MPISNTNLKLALKLLALDGETTPFYVDRRQRCDMWKGNREETRRL